jgi:ketosteroid isomerase-like protein
MIYRAIVRRRVHRLFAEANQGRWTAIVDGLAPTFSYRFVGDTPLGGTRTSHAAMRLWFERLYRLFPGSVFVPQSVVVEGVPWRTNIMTHVLIRGTVPGTDGATSDYENEFMQRMVLRWGKITSVVTVEDTQRFVDLLPALADVGIPDATAAPITDSAAA